MSNTITWTIAFRNPRANRFRRVTNWNGTWDQASELARAYVTLNPQLQVWVTTTKEAEDAGHTVEEDRGTIMVESGRRVKVIDNAELSARELAELQVITFERIGREAAQADEPAAPAANAKVQAALEGRVVGDPANARIMEAFSRGYQAVRDAQADAVLAEPVEAPAAPQPRYVAVKSDSQSFPFMVHDNRRNQTVPGSSVTNMEAAAQHAARLNALPHYYAGIEHGTMAWCVQENRVGGPRCSTRWFGDDAQAQAEAKALEMNQEEGLLLPEPVIEEDHYPLTALEMEIEADAIEAAGEQPAPVTADDVLTTLGTDLGTDRSDYVTEQVSLWLQTDGDYIKDARRAADAGIPNLAAWARIVILTSVKSSAPWQVKQELAPNDWARIDWAQIVEDIKPE